MNIASLVSVKKNPHIPQLEPGDRVKVHARIVEGGKERIQMFQGVVIGLRKNSSGGNFTVRHVAYGIGVERTFPFASPMVEKVEIVRSGKVRRAKLYYLRGRSGKASRLKEKRVDRRFGQVVEPETEAEEIAEAELEEEVVAAETDAEVTEAEVETTPTAEGTPVTEEKAVAEVKDEPVAEVTPVVEETPAAEEAAVAEVKDEPVAEVAPEEPVTEDEPVAAVTDEPVAEAAPEEPTSETEEKPA